MQELDLEAGFFLSLQMDDAIPNLSCEQDSVSMLVSMHVVILQLEFFFCSNKPLDNVDAAYPA